MRRLLMMVVLSAYACASTTYYVSSSAGSDSYTATQAQNPATPWQTLAKVGLSTFAAGDRIMLARGDVWREALVPPSPGIGGAPIVFDAYGSGEAPKISGYRALSGWTTAGTNQWKASLTAAALQLTEAVANREIVDEIKFKSGLGKIIDGTVECLNASSWARPQ